ncbi:MAG: hypothetical protein ACO3EK_19175, partial [Alphaproteobacteria bacterium]
VQIVPIQCSSIITASGAIHCIVKQVPRRTDALPAAHVIAPAGGELWLDGGHNEEGARAIAAWARGLGDGLPLDIVVALRSTKRAEPILAALAPVARSIVCAGIPDAREAADVAAGLRLLDAPRRVLVCGSLYLAGAVLAENG